MILTTHIITNIPKYKTTFRFRIIHIHTVVIMYNSKPKFAVENYTLLNYDKPLVFLNL